LSRLPPNYPTHKACGKQHLPQSASANMPTAPDAMDQMKRAFKGLFKKKPKTEEPTPTATTAAPSASAPAHPPASETTPPAPLPATAPESAKTEATPGTSSSAPPPAPEPAHAPVQQAAAPAPVQQAAAPAPAKDEANKDETTALAEVKRATHSRSTSHSTPPFPFHSSHDSDGSRWRHRLGTHDDWSDPF
jgi:hypothetical protein